MGFNSAFNCVSLTTNTAHKINRDSKQSFPFRLVLGYKAILWEKEMYWEETTDIVMLLYQYTSADVMQSMYCTTIFDLHVRK